MKGKEKNMTEIRSIIQRLKLGQSIRQIHYELCVHRTIIRELYDLAIIHCWLDPKSSMPSDEEISKIWNLKKKIQTHPLDAHKEQIKEWHKQNLSSVVIRRLLKEVCACSCDIQMIRRYRKKHFPKLKEPIMVRSTVPGRDMEVDFGYLGKFLDDDGMIKKVWLFSLRLRHSRRVYREVVFDQSTSTFLMGHVHAFEYFNGVPKYVFLDNLKAGVIQSSIDNDKINRSYQELAEYYGFIISPCLPRKPEHKGGVEGDIKYTTKNFLAYFLAKQKSLGMDISKVRDLKEDLERWNKEEADLHLVYGLDRSPFEIFKSEEEKALLPLSKNRWELTSWRQCVVRKDWRIMVDGAYYSVPYQLINQTVDVCIKHSVVRIFHEHKEVALHETAKNKWDYRRKTEHAPPHQEAVLQCSREGLLILAEEIGPFTYQLTHTILSNPTLDKLRPVRNLLRLINKYSKERLEKACQRAFDYKVFSYVGIKGILEKNLDSEPINTPKADKVVHLQQYRFQRNPEDYKSCHHEHRSETFEERLIRLNPVSKHGNAMMGAYEGFVADKEMEKERLKK